MLKKFNKFMWLSVIICAIFGLLGVILLIFPETSIKIISYLVAFTLIIVGITLIADYSGSLFSTSFLPTGILAIVLGLIVLIYPASISILIPIVVGIWMIINSVVNMQMALSLQRAGYKNWLFTVILSSITVLCGFLIIVNPNSGAIALTEFFGIMLLIYSISNIITLVIFKSNINDIGKYLK